MKGLVIIPTYNEKANIKKIVPLVLKQDKDISVLVVDDNSPDGTGKAVKAMMMTRANHRSNEGRTHGQKIGSDSFFPPCVQRDA